MQHFFVSPEQVKEGKIYVEGGDVNHMKNVLRMKTGEELTVNDGEGSQYLCAVESYEADMAVLKILGKRGRERACIKDLSVPGTSKAGQDGTDRAEVGRTRRISGNPGGDKASRGQAGCEEGEEEGRTLAADCGQCGEAGRTRYYS